MLPILLSNRARQTPASPIRRLAHVARKARSDGKQVYHLNIGQPDILTPKEFYDGLHAYRDQVVAYETSEGNERLRAAWVKYMDRSLGLNINKDQMLITTGASEALIFTFMTCCDPGDDVLIFDPTYANYIGFAAIAGVRLVSVVTHLEDSFALPALEEIAAKITNRTRAILLCSPNNPTGTVYTEKELQLLLNMCNEHNIFLVVDETYRELVYDGIKPLSILHLDSNNQRIIVIDSLSKRFSLCGARLGCMITTNQEVLAKTLNQAQARLASASIEQFAAAHMLEVIGDNFQEQVRSEFQSRRDVLYQALQDIPEVEVYQPQGAFYMLAQLPFDDAEEFASWMLSEFSYEGATVFVSPAAGFYMEDATGKNKIRLAFVLNQADLKKAIKVLGKGIESYQQRKII